jgi:hypothetical protein
MPLLENVLVYTGNRVKVEVNGHEVGLCQSVRVNDNYNLQAASGVGDIHVQEWVPTQAIHQLTVQTMILYKDKINSATGVSSLPGAFDGTDIMENGDAVLRGLTFDLSIEGKAPSNFQTAQGARGGRQPLTSGDLGRQIRVYQGCTFESGDIDVTKHQIIVQNASFRALDVTGNPTATSQNQTGPAGQVTPA